MRLREWIPSTSHFQSFPENNLQFPIDRTVTVLFIILYESVGCKPESGILLFRSVPTIAVTVFMSFCTREMILCNISRTFAC